jgi:iron complex transport system substrate-binding protein
MEDVWREITEVGGLFGAADRAAALVAEQRALVADARGALAGGEPPAVLWWDGGDDPLTAGACCGAPAMLLDAVGLENVFGDVDGSWADVSWEQVLERDPDVIVLVDADWHTAEEKRARLTTDPVLRELDAVQEGRMVVLPFSATTPGVRNAAAVLALAEGIAALDAEG